MFLEQVATTLSSSYLLQKHISDSSFTGPFSLPIESPAVTFDQLVKHVGVNKGVLDRECSDEHLREIAALLHNWLKYAELLGLKGHQIRDIDSNKLLDSEMKAHKVLRLWKKANAFKATYSSLVKVCLSQRDSDEAEKICESIKGEFYLLMTLC